MCGHSSVGVFYEVGDGVVESTLITRGCEVVERLVQQRMDETILCMNVFMMGSVMMQVCRCSMTIKKDHWKCVVACFIKGRGWRGGRRETTKLPTTCDE